jgi:CDP-diglyceride synthetase
MQNTHEHGGMSEDASRKNYRMLALNLVAGAVIMYFGMFAMIWSGGEFIQNINFFYMALIMWAPMSAVMVWTMRNMYPSKRLNLALYLMFALIFVLSFWGIRDQLLVGDRQFLRSMIPHHSGAILMCERSNLSDPEIKVLCAGIVQTQKEEIAQMKALLSRKQGS